MTHTILLAGGTGNLGHRIASALQKRGATVKALVRPGTTGDAVDRLERAGAEIVRVDLGDHAALVIACTGVDCVVSALSGLHAVIVDGQTQLLEAAVEAGVPRFIPSDFSIDYTPLKPGSNRNFDLRREFRARLDKAPIHATSIFNGAFMDMLNGQAPIIIKPLRRVVYWNDADLPIDFTTMDDTAAFTAAAALEDATPRDLHIAGERTSARGLEAAMSAVSGHRFGLFRAGGVKRLAGIIRITRRLFPQPDEVFSVWQGMQYLHNMFSGEAGTPPLDNDRYSGMRWTEVREMLAQTAAASAAGTPGARSG